MNLQDRIDPPVEPTAPSTVNTKTCTNGHTMTGIGFDECPECEEPWLTAPVEKYDVVLTEPLLIVGDVHRNKIIEEFLARDNHNHSVLEGIDALVNNNGKHISIESTYDGWRVYNGADDTGTWYGTLAEALNALINKQ
jgi:hypothetical protein